MKERSQFRDNLLAGYMRCLPSILRDLPPQSLQAGFGSMTQRSVGESVGLLGWARVSYSSQATKEDSKSILPIATYSLDPLPGVSQLDH